MALYQEDSVQEGLPRLAERAQTLLYGQGGGAGSGQQVAHMAGGGRDGGQGRI